MKEVEIEMAVREAPENAMLKRKRKKAKRKKDARKSNAKFEGG